MLSPQSVEKFAKIYEREFGVALSNEDAAAQAQRFLTAARVVMQPMPKRFEKRYKELLTERERRL